MVPKPTYEELEQRIKELEKEAAESGRLAEILRRKEEEYRLLAENASDVIWTMDMNLEYLYISPSVTRLKGYSAEEAMALALEDTLSEDSYRMVMKVFEEELDVVKSVENDLLRYRTLELEQRCKDGSTVWTEDRVCFLRDPDGSPVGILGVTRDITERKRTVEENTALKEQLRQAQKMESIGTLAGGIAHDLNNILGVVIGCTELAVLDSADKNEVLQHLEKVLKAGERAKELVSHILAFNRRGKFEKKSLLLSHIIEEAVNLLRSTLPSTIEIRQSSKLETGYIMADASQMHLILMSLCTNAAHAMRDKGGILELSLETVELDLRAIAPYPELAPGSYLKLSVSDTGHGIDKSVRDHIFEPYFTTKREEEGPGLGLSVVHYLVKSHGGIIEVDSQPGKGCTFHIFLPRIDIVEQRANPARVSAFPAGRERILLVDDEKVLAHTVERMLARMGYEVTTLTSSVEALEAFRDHPDKFDLVITDQTMPNMTGVHLAKELHKIRPRCPVVLCTGFSEAITPENAKTIGIQEVIMKPLDSGILAETIHKVLQMESSP